MPPRHLHLIGLDPGGTTGYCRLTVPRESIFGREPGDIWERDYGEFQGSEVEQASDIATWVREVQSLDYPNGPAIVTEAWDQDPTFKSTDPEALSPARINAMLELLRYQKKLADATLTYQSRTMAKKTATDERLKVWGMYVAGSEHVKDAHRHAITALRRAKTSPEFARMLWPR
jgi:hypothetical protein